MIEQKSLLAIGWAGEFVYTVQYKLSDKQWFSKYTLAATFQPIAICPIEEQVQPMMIKPDSGWMCMGSLTK